METTFVLWGQHRAVDWNPLKLSSGTIGEVRADLAFRASDHNCSGLAILALGEPYDIGNV